MTNSNLEAVIPHVEDESLPKNELENFMIRRLYLFVAF
jgi:hypothetical protein